MQRIFLLGKPDNKLNEDFELTERKLTPGRWYMGSLTPTMYDPNTLQPAEPSYIVTCDDGKARKVDSKYFITLEEWRENQFNKIGL